MPNVVITAMALALTAICPHATEAGGLSALKLRGAARAYQKDARGEKNTQSGEVSIVRYRAGQTRHLPRLSLSDLRRLNGESNRWVLSYEHPSSRKPRSVIVQGPRDFQQRRVRGERLPIVVNLHGLTMDAAEYDAMSGVGELLPDRLGAVVLTPNGSSSFGIRSWNAGIGRFAGRRRVDDRDFIETLVRDVRRELNLGPAVIMGLSNGGGMAFDLLAHSNSFVGGALLAPLISEKQLHAANVRVPMLVIQGARDTVISKDGKATRVTRWLRSSPVAPRAVVEYVRHHGNSRAHYLETAAPGAGTHYYPGGDYTTDLIGSAFQNLIKQRRLVDFVSSTSTRSAAAPL